MKTPIKLEALGQMARECTTDEEIRDALRDALELVNARKHALTDEERLLAAQAKAKARRRNEAMAAFHALQPVEGEMVN